MKNFLDKHFSTIAIVALVLFLWSRGMFNPPPQAQSTVIVVSDTTDKNHTGTVITQPGEIRYIPYPVERVREILQDTSLVRKTVEDYYSTRVQKDSIKLDSLGSVTATTYTTKNTVDSIKWDYNIKERVITNNITIKEPYQPRRQVLVGGEITGTYPGGLVTQVEAGILYKNKKDQVLGASGGYNLPLHSFVVTAKYYVPISFRKK